MLEKPHSALWRQRIVDIMHKIHPGSKECRLKTLKDSRNRINTNEYFVGLFFEKPETYPKAGDFVNKLWKIYGYIINERSKGLEGVILLDPHQKQCYRARKNRQLWDLTILKEIFIYKKLIFRFLTLHSLHRSSEKYLLTIGQKCKSYLVKRMITLIISFSKRKYESRKVMLKGDTF